MRLLGFAVAAVLLALPAQSQEAGAKRELRYKFEKGGKYVFALAQKMHVKLDEVPEAFQGILPEEPFDSAFEGQANLEVKDVSEQGVATLAGRFQTLKAKGSFLGREFDFSYDSTKEKEKPKAKEEGAGGAYDPEAVFQELATAELKIEIDSLGKIKADAGGSGAKEQASLIFSLVRLSGEFPREKVGPGDTWKNADLIAIPQMPFKVRLRSENTFEKTEKAGDAECAVIRSKFSAGTEGGDAKEEEGASQLPIKIDIKFAGDGKGATRFALDAGRMVDNETGLDLKLTAVLPGEEEGDGITIKGGFKVEQTLKVQPQK